MTRKQRNGHPLNYADTLFQRFKRFDDVTYFRKSLGSHIFDDRICILHYFTLYDSVIAEKNVVYKQGGDGHGHPTHNAYDSTASDILDNAAIVATAHFRKILCDGTDDEPEKRDDGNCYDVVDHNEPLVYVHNIEKRSTSVNL